MGTTTTIVDPHAPDTQQRLEQLARRADELWTRRTGDDDGQRRAAALRDLAEAAADYLDATPAGDRQLRQHAQLLAATIAARVQYLLEWADL